MTQLLEKIRTDLSQALKEKKEIEVSALRLLLAEVHNKEIEKQGELIEEEVIGVIRKQIRLRQEAIESYQKGERKDLEQKERDEMKILSKYLPQMISPQELEKIVDSKIKQLGAKGPQDFGKVMGEVMKEVKGQADGAEVAKLVKERLTKS